jgi:hypothetical protein
LKLNKVFRPKVSLDPKPGIFYQRLRLSLLPGIESLNLEIVGQTWRPGIPNSIVAQVFTQYEKKLKNLYTKQKIII